MENGQFLSKQGFFQDSLWRSKVTLFFLHLKPVIVHALKIALNKPIDEELTIKDSPLFVIRGYFPRRESHR